MTTLTAPAPTTTPAGSAQSAMLLVVVAPARSRCEKCKGHGGYVPTVWLSDGSACSGQPEICDECKGLGYR